MNKINYNQALSTFSPVSIEGMLAMHSLPLLAQPNITAQRNKSVSGSTYFGSVNTATYSHTSSLFTGEYRHPDTKFERPWLTPELKDFLHHSPHISLDGIDHLLLAIRDTYGNVEIDHVMHVDPEEEWIKPVFIVHSGVADFDTLMNLEDDFFAKAASNSRLLAILPCVVVSQA